MATIHLKTRDKQKPTMREMAVGEILRVPLKRTTNHLKVTANEQKCECGQVYEVDSTSNLFTQLVTRIK